MADQKLTAVRTGSPFVSPLAADDLLYLVQDTGTTPDERAITASELSDELNVTTRYLMGSVSNPQAVYAQRPQIFMFQAPWAMTITKIHISNPTTDDIAGDLKFADDTLTGVFANATVVDVCDTSSGVFTVSASSDMDDATVPADKYIYFSLDSSPAAAVKDFFIRVDYQVD